MRMFNKINHQYSWLANQTINWLPSDDEGSYINHLKTHNQLLQDNNWIDKKFTYKFNSHGFRCNEFTTEPNVMFLGCSHTFGMGVPIENTWTYLVSQELKLNMTNLGVAGAGTDTAFRLANHYISQLQPKIVIYLQPQDSRFCLFRKNDFLEFNSWHTNKDLYADFYTDWAINEENLKLHGLKHKLAIEAICNQNNIKLITLTTDHFALIDFARDLAHHGVKSSKRFSEKVLAYV